MSKSTLDAAGHYIVGSDARDTLRMLLMERRWMSRDEIVAGMKKYGLNALSQDGWVVEDEGWYTTSLELLVASLAVKDAYIARLSAWCDMVMTPPKPWSYSMEGHYAWEEREAGKRSSFALARYDTAVGMRGELVERMRASRRQQEIQGFAELTHPN